jgi:hypothetical protein
MTPGLSAAPKPRATEPAPRLLVARSRLGRGVVAGLAWLALTSCGGGGDPAGSSSQPGVQSDTFLAFAEDFRGYHAWPSYDVTEDADLVGIHDGSTVIEYIDELPPSGSLEFPLGTMVVKEATGGTLPHELFAMAKRGPGYNRDAPGWEWFELENLEDGRDGVKIIWRGAGPPIGETYGADLDSGCNTCHTDCGNDAVCAKALRLLDF